MPGSPDHPIAEPEPRNSEADEREGTRPSNETHPQPIIVAVAPKPRRRIPKRPLVLFCLAIALIAGAIGGYVWMTRDRETTNDAQVPAELEPIRAQVSGRIEHQLVKENQTVKAGQLLVTIDDVELRAKRDRLEADLAAAEAAVTASTQPPPSSAPQIAAAQADVDRARADAERGRHDLDAANGHRGWETASFMEHLALVSSAADAALDEAKARLNVVRETRSAAIANANSELAHAKVRNAAAQLKLAELQLGHAKIAARADGRVLRVLVQEGELVQKGRIVAELVSNSSCVMAKFKKTQEDRIRPGQHADISFDASPGRKFAGTVMSTPRAARWREGTYQTADELLDRDPSCYRAEMEQRTATVIRSAVPFDVPLRPGS
jgi:membrane fusion protein, multidrug efflux system